MRGYRRAGPHPVLCACVCVSGQPSRPRGSHRRAVPAPLAGPPRPTLPATSPPGLAAGWTETLPERGVSPAARSLWGRPPAVALVSRHRAVYCRRQCGPLTSADLSRRVSTSGGFCRHVSAGAAAAPPPPPRSDQPAHVTGTWTLPTSVQPPSALPGLCQLPSAAADSHPLMNPPAAGRYRRAWVSAGCREGRALSVRRVQNGRQDPRLIDHRVL